MKIIFNRKVEVEFNASDERRLDGQSKICNWLYNHLLEMCSKDYKNNEGEKNLLSSRNLRDLIPSLKKEFSFLKAVYSSPLKNVAMRLKRAFSKFFSEENVGYPKFRKWQGNWFSLLYDEPNKGYKLLDENRLSLSLGVDKEGRRLRVVGKLKESLCLRETDEIKNFRLCKEYDRFYVICCIEREPVKSKDVESFLAIDPNHKNFFVAVDNEGNSFEFSKIPQLKFWDNEIDRIKSKRDKCERKSIKVTENEGKNYWLPSKNWSRRNRALQTAYRKRREQLKQVRFTVGNWIAHSYDYVAIGDYTPSLETAVYDTMHRSMLNQEMIGSFRRDLKWTMERSGKQYMKVSEKETTKTCCVCGLKEKKDPSVRKFVCPNCHSRLARDINSAVNIAKKDKLLSGSDYEGWNLSSPSYTVEWDFRKCELLFAGNGEKKFSSLRN